MIFSQREGAEIDIFDVNGNFVATLDFTLKSHLIHRRLKGRLVVKTKFLSIDLYDFLYDKNNSEESDFNKDISNDFYDTYLVKSDTKPCRLIIRTYVNDEITGKLRKVIYEVPKALIHTTFNRLNDSSGAAVTYRLIFDLLPFNDQRHVYKIHVEKSR